MTFLNANIAFSAIFKDTYLNKRIAFLSDWISLSHVSPKCGELGRLKLNLVDSKFISVVHVLLPKMLLESLFQHPRNL